MALRCARKYALPKSNLACPAFAGSFEEAREECISRRGKAEMWCAQITPECFDIDFVFGMPTDRGEPSPNLAAFSVAGPKGNCRFWKFCAKGREVARAAWRAI